MSVIFTSHFVSMLKPTLNAVWADGTDDEQEYKNFCMSDPLSDAYDDDLPVAGPGWAYEVGEGQEIPTGSAREHIGHRYAAVKRGLRMIITEEAVEDNKYTKSVDMARMLKRAMSKTKDMTAALKLLQRGFNTSYTQVDGKPVWSATQTLASGGSFSNLFATSASPSVAAMITADTMARTMPGLDGIKSRVKLEGIICPIALHLPWKQIVDSTADPEATNSGVVNVASDRYTSLPKGVKPITFWDNTETSYAFLTDAENGFKYRQRRALKVRTYMDNASEKMSHQATERYDFGMSNPRCTIGVNA